MILLITYDLNSPGQDYKNVHDEIKTAGTWWHHLDSTWIIQTEKTTNYWQKKLHKHMDKNDSLLIIKVCKDYQGWLPDKAWKWLRERNFTC